jgi:hypothetical protein
MEALADKLRTLETPPVAEPTPTVVINFDVNALAEHLARAMAGVGIQQAPS